MILCGVDAADFLQALITQDVRSLGVKTLSYGALLDRKGAIRYPFAICRAQEDPSAFEIYLTPKDELAFKEALQFYLFAEEVEIKESSDSPLLLVGPEGVHFCQNNPHFSEQALSLRWGVEPAWLIRDASAFAFLSSLDTLSLKDEEELSRVLYLERGLPPFAAMQGILFNDLHIGSYFLAENKGCYPGQEVVTRIRERGRAPRRRVGLILDKAPLSNTSIDELWFEEKKVGHVLETFQIPLSSSHFAIALVNESLLEKIPFPVLLTSQESGGIVAKIHSLPFVDSPFVKAQALKAYEKGLSFYHNNQMEEAKIALEEAIAWDETDGDAYEALAMVEEKQGSIEKAIALNKQFAQRLPHSVMAHTNLSRLYMFKGWIEKAEEEQQKAQDLYFRLQQQEGPKITMAASAIEEQNRKLQAERERKIEIFHQVLDMDPDDEIAHFGLGKIFCDTQKWDEGIPHLIKVLENNIEYSAAYPLLVKCLIGNSESEKAKEVALKGIEIAKNKGDLMPMKQLEILLKKL